jgi:hypothetical protein
MTPKDLLAESIGPGRRKRMLNEEVDMLQENTISLLNR